jgi:hypothetical protein
LLIIVAKDYCFKISHLMPLILIFKNYLLASNSFNLLLVYLCIYSHSNGTNAVVFPSIWDHFIHLLLSLQDLSFPLRKEKFPYDWICGFPQTAYLITYLILFPFFSYSAQHFNQCNCLLLCSLDVFPSPEF